MDSKKSRIIFMVLIVPAIFVFSSVLIHSAIAVSSTSKSISNSGLSEYTSFKKCLSQSEGTKGFATSQEIKNCYNPIYHPTGTSTGPSSMIKSGK